jgi:hypothetical protein
VSNRRLAAEAVIPTQTPVHTASANRPVSITGGMTVREAVLAGGFLRSTERTDVEKSAPDVPRLAYTVAELAAAIGVSDQQIYNHIKRGDIKPKYSGKKTIIPVAEAQRFFDELPDEDYGALMGPS